MNFGWIVSVLLKGTYVNRLTVLRDIVILTERISCCSFVLTLNE